MVGATVALVMLGRPLDNSLAKRSQLLLATWLLILALCALGLVFFVLKRSQQVAKDRHSFAVLVEVSELTRHGANYATAAGIMRAEAAKNPTLDNYMVLGRLLEDARQYGNAVAAYTTALQLPTGSHSNRSELIDNVHLGLGRALAQLGRYQAAREELARAMALASHDPDAVASARIRDRVGRLLTQIGQKR